MIDSPEKTAHFLGYIESVKTKLGSKARTFAPNDAKAAVSHVEEMAVRLGILDNSSSHTVESIDAAIKRLIDVQKAATLYYQQAAIDACAQREHHLNVLD